MGKSASRESGGSRLLIENTFDVPAPLDRVWAYLLDVEKLVPCMPGAQLTETVDDRTWKGKITVKLGPVSLSFSGTVVMAERDDTEHRVVLKATGMEQRGKGAASAVVTSWLEVADGVTRVTLSQEITVSGTVAQFSRGMMQDVSAKLTKQFADCLQANMGVADEAASSSAPSAQGTPSPQPPPSPQVAAKQVRGLRLALWAFLRAIRRFLARLFGRGRAT